MAQAATPPQTEVRPPQVCTEQYYPVCGEKGGARKTYSNACFAAADGASVVNDGQCPPIGTIRPNRQ